MLLRRSTGLHRRPCPHHELCLHFFPLLSPACVPHAAVPLWRLWLGTAAPVARAAGSGAANCPFLPSGEAKAEGEGLGADGQEHKEDTFDVFVRG